MMWPSRNRLQDMIEQAMQDRASEMHRRMKTNGTLQAKMSKRQSGELADKDHFTPPRAKLPSRWRRTRVNATRGIMRKSVEPAKIWP